MTNLPAYPTAHRQQRGAVLAMALVFLTILSLVGIYSMRGSILGEQVSKNMRANAVATQAAETALRYCEDEVLKGSTALIIHEVDALATSVEGLLPEDRALPGKWLARTNWSDDTVSMETPSSQLAASGMLPLSVLPRCMVERFNLPPLAGETIVTQPYLVTAVGFSADYEVDGSNRPIRGGEVWLQSFLTP